MSLGALYSEQDEQVLSKNAYRKALLLQPTDFNAYLELGKWSQLESDFSTAMSLYDVASILHPEPSLADVFRRKIKVQTGLLMEKTEPGGSNRAADHVKLQSFLNHPL